MHEHFRAERHFGALGWLWVQWQEYRHRVGCHRLPCHHVVCEMYRQAELSNLGNSR